MLIKTFTLKVKLIYPILQHKWPILAHITWWAIYLFVMQQYEWAVEEIVFSTRGSKSYLVLPASKSISIRTVAYSLAVAHLYPSACRLKSSA